MSRPADPTFSAVIVAWNSADHLRGCLAALRQAAEAAGLALETIVVDNASRDDSPATAREAGVSIVVENPVNAGFSVAAAQGLALAGGEWLLLVNPDLAVDEGFLVALREAARRAPSDVATLVPDIRTARDSTIVESRGLAVDAAGVPHELESCRPAAEADEPLDVFGGSSGACAIRRSALDELGGPEPAFFAYLEDVDLAWRLQRAGYRALFIPAARAFHAGSASAGRASWLKVYLVARSRRILFNLNGPRTARARVARLVVECGHAVAATALGGGTAPWRGRAAALRARGYVRFVRRARALHDRRVREPSLVSMPGMLATLRTKRRRLH